MMQHADVTMVCQSGNTIDHIFDGQWCICQSQFAFYELFWNVL
jgi:hypothetical protein